MAQLPSQTVSVVRAIALVLAAGLLLTGCEGNRIFDPNQDPPGKLSRADFERLKDRRPVEIPKAEPPIPALQPVLATPQQPLGAADRLVSISVTDSVPLKDVLIELARRAELDLQLDPRISGGVVFSAHDQPLGLVLERLCDLAGLRFTINGTFVRIELDEPFYQTYRLDVLNLRRNTTSSTSISTNVFAAVGGGSSGAGNNSTSAVAGESINDFWVEVERNLTQIMANSSRARALGAPVPVESAAASTSAASSTPAAAPQTSVTASPIGAVAAALGAATGAGAALTATQAPATPAAAIAAPVPTNTSAPASQAAGATAAAASTTAAGASDIPTFSVNRQTGIVSIFGTRKQQELARSYISKLRRQAGTQVLIEGRIIEVTLNEEFRAGINWRTVFGGDLNAAFDSAPGNPNNTFAIAPSATVTPFTTAAGIPQSVFTGVFNNIGGRTNLAAIVQLIETFGTARTLSSPRLTVLNNQTAILKVAQNQVYFNSTITPGLQATATSPATATTVSSTASTVPVGLVMAVQPVIDADTGTITMTLRPTISRIVGNVADPGVALAAATVPGGGAAITSQIPVVEVREIDSVLRMQDGNVVIMGGLMRDDSQNTDAGIPGASSIPFLGNLFKSRTQTANIVELVILLRATILDNPQPDPADVDLYKRYNRDPRPLNVN